MSCHVFIKDMLSYVYTTNWRYEMLLIDQRSYRFIFAHVLLTGLFFTPSLAANTYPYQVPGDYSTLSEAVAASGANQVTLRIVDQTTVTANLIVPSNVSLIFNSPGKLYINSGVLLTINGSVQADSYQIFDGPGSVSGKFITPTIYPEWFF